MIWRRWFAHFILKVNRFVNPDWDNLFYLANLKEFQKNIFGYILLILPFIPLLIFLINSLEFFNWVMTSFIFLHFLVAPIINFKINKIILKPWQNLSSKTKIDFTVPYYFFLFLIYLGSSILFDGITNPLMYGLENPNFNSPLVEFLQNNSLIGALALNGGLLFGSIIIGTLTPMLFLTFIFIFSVIIKTIAILGNLLEKSISGTSPDNTLKPIPKDFKITDHNTPEEKALEEILD